MVKNVYLLLICVAEDFDGSYGKESFSFMIFYTGEIVFTMLIVVLRSEPYSFIPSDSHMQSEINLGRLGKSRSRSFRIFRIRMK